MEAISMFEDTVMWHRAAGASPLEAKHRAIDEYRKFTRRQVQGEAYDVLVETSLVDETPSFDDILNTNQVFEKLIKGVATHPRLRAHDRERGVKFVCAMFRYFGAEESLFEDNQNVIQSILGSFFPDSEWQIAEFLGYKVAATGSCNAYNNWKKWLKTAATEMNLK